MTHGITLHEVKGAERLVGGSFVN
eukprot:SAG25_NODE_4849_length_741_cov_1.121495_1_plen_23_part_10